MNNKRVLLAFFLVAAMSLSVLVAPLTPLRQTASSTPSAFTPEELKQIENYQKLISQPGYTPEVDPLLSSWQSGYSLDENVFAPGGLPSVLIFGAPSMDIEKVRATVNLNWWVDLGLFKVVKATLPNGAALSNVLAVKGVTTVTADKILASPDQAPTGTTEPDMFRIREVVGATGTTASSYTGDGVLVGHVDTGVDFGQPDLQHAYDADSYDPTGSGLGYSIILGNRTNVANVTAWLEAGNYLTFVNATGTYLNWTGSVLPPCNYDGVNVLTPYTYFHSTGGLNGAAARAFFDANMWGKPYKIPDTSAVNGDYHFGFMLQGKPTVAGAGGRILTPVLVYNSTSDNEWHLAVDWAGAWCYANYYEGVFRYYTWDFTDPAVQNAILSVIDFDFTDDIVVEDYSLTNPVVAHDYTGDGTDDYSIGSLCWVYDGISIYFEIFSDQFVFHGFRSDGNAFALYFDGDRADGGHGTATAAHVASAGTHTYYNFQNNTYFQMKGIAPDAKILSTKAITSGAWYGALLWCSGFSYNATTDAFYYSGNHKADLVTNSWGFITEPSGQFNYLDFTWEVLSLPGYFSPSYPGVLHVFSAGNEGSGFMTASPPGSAAAVLTVGASTTSHWLEYLYGPNQDIQGIASFTSKGPDFSGYPKPDILAPGAAGYSALPTWISYFIPLWNPTATGVIYPPMGYQAGWNYTQFSGTSQSAPVAAGCAALLIEALNARSFAWQPMDIKTILQSTAFDMGYDPATQGFGRIDIEAACDFAVNDNGAWFSNTDSYHTNALLLDEAWAFWGVMNNGAAANTTKKLSDVSANDGSIFFGAVKPNDVVTVHQKMFRALGTTWETNGASYTTSAYYMRKAVAYTFTDTTFSYNDTVMKDTQMYGWFNLRDEIGTSNYDSAVGTYSYMTVGVSFDAGEVSGVEPWMFLYDWTDNDPNDGKPNLWNVTADLGDELSRMTSASNPSNTNMMPFAASGPLSGAVDGNITLIVHDPVHDPISHMSDPGHLFTCTVIFWEEAVASIGIIDDSTDSSTFNITLTVPSNAQTGIHQGFVDIDNGDWRIPYSYNVVADLAGAEGEVNTIVNGYGTELSPYDSAMYGCMGFETGSWDYRSYAFTNSHATAAYFGIRVVWSDPGNGMYVTLYGSDGRDIASGATSTGTTTALLANVTATNTGMFYLLVHAEAVNGTVSLPVPYSIEVIWYESSRLNVGFTWTANDSPTPAVIAPSSTLTGDHVVVAASMPSTLLNMPEYDISGMTISFLSGLYVHKTGAVATPSSENWPFNPTRTDTYAMEIVGPFKTGDVIHVRLEMFDSAADPALLLFQYNGVPLAATDLPLATFDAGTTGDTVETGTYIAPSEMTIAFVIYSFFYTGAFPDTYDLVVDSRLSQDAVGVGPSASFDTYAFLKNATMGTRVTVTPASTFSTNIQTVYEYGDLLFENLFAPHVTVTVSGTGAVKTVTLGITDRNVGDQHFYEWYLSRDIGVTWELVAVHQSAASFTWDSTGFLQSSYKIKVIMWDNDPVYNNATWGNYWPGLEAVSESALFTAGTVTTPTIITTTTTTTTVPVGPGIDPLWIGLFGGIGVGILVILILFLVRKK